MCCQIIAFHAFCSHISPPTQNSSDGTDEEETELFLQPMSAYALVIHCTPSSTVSFHLGTHQSSLALSVYYTQTNVLSKLILFLKSDIQWFNYFQVGARLLIQLVLQTLGFKRRVSFCKTKSNSSISDQSVSLSIPYLFWDRHTDTCLCMFVYVLSLCMGSLLFIRCALSRVYPTAY